METKEERNDAKEPAAEWPNMSCCGTQSGQSAMPDCRSMMSKCMKGFRWFPLMPVVVGVVLLLLGYYLDPQVTRILWMIAAGVVIVMGTFGLFIMSKVKTMCCGAE